MRVTRLFAVHSCVVPVDAYFAKHFSESLPHCASFSLVLSCVQRIHFSTKAYKCRCHFLKIPPIPNNMAEAAADAAVPAPAAAPGAASDATAVPGKGYKDEDIVIEGYLRVRANHGIAGLRPW